MLQVTQLASVCRIPFVLHFSPTKTGPTVRRGDESEESKQRGRGLRQTRDEIGISWAGAICGNAFLAGCRSDVEETPSSVRGQWYVATTGPPVFTQTAKSMMIPEFGLSVRVSSLAQHKAHVFHGLSFTLVTREQAKTSTLTYTKPHAQTLVLSQICL